MSSGPRLPASPLPSGGPGPAGSPRPSPAPLAAALCLAEDPPAQALIRCLGRDVEALGSMDYGEDRELLLRRVLMTLEAFELCVMRFARARRAG